MRFRSKICVSSCLNLWVSITSAHLIEKSFLPPLYCFCPFFRNQWVMFVLVSFWFLYSVTLIYVSLLYQYHSLDYHGYIKSLETGHSFFTLFFFFKIFTIPVPLFSHIKFWIILCVSTNNLFGILMGIALLLLSIWGKLISSLYKIFHCIFLHFFRYLLSSISIV